MSDYAQRRHALDPIKFGKWLWPQYTFYQEQKDLIYSVVDNDETFAPAGNMLGKDFTAAFVTLWFFLTRHPCRVVTTSADYSQLHSVLWGEIRRLVQESRYPLSREDGGPLVVNDLHLRKVVKGQVCGLSYVLGRVASKGEGMLGHHVSDVGDGIPRSMFLADEASGVEDQSYNSADTWAKRKLIIGNPYPCNNFFKRGVKAGDLLAPPASQREGEPAPRPRYYRKVIRIKAERSPNVRLAMAQRAAGQEPTGEIIVPGVLPWADYLKRRLTWDPVKQCIGLDADFYEGAEELLFAPQWLNRAEALHEGLRGRVRKAKALGVDPAEGGDNTTLAAVDELGLIELVSVATPDTNVIPGLVIEMGERHGIPPEKWVLDRGGGGKQAADRLRAKGRKVETVAFGESVTPKPRRGMQPADEIVRQREERYTYVNRRAQLYGRLSERLDPGAEGSSGFALPSQYGELRRQLALIPKLYDEEGRLRLPPKNRRSPGGEKTLREILGCSPDEADALVLAVYGLESKRRRVVAGAMF